MAKHYIGLSGRNRSGKDTVAHVITQLAEPRRTDMIRTSDSLNVILSEYLKIPMSRENQQALSTGIRTEFGQDIMVRGAKRRACASIADIVIINGIRLLGDVALLSSLPGFLLVCVDAPAKVRYQRMVKANERPGDALKTWDQFLAEDSQECEQSLDKVAEHAHVVLDNSRENNNHSHLIRQVTEYILPRL